MPGESILERRARSNRIAGRDHRGFVPESALRNQKFADSPLEGNGFEPSVGDASPPPRAWLLSFGGTFCRTANAPSGSAQAVLKWIWENWAWVFSRSGSGICPVVRVVPLPASAMRNSSSFLTPLRNEQIRPGDLHECTFFDAAPSATSCRYLGVR